MDSSFLNLLVSPVSKKKLSINEEKNILSDGEHVFSIKDGVPILLPPVKETDGSEFKNYQEHYEKDAEAFDYFEDFVPLHQEENRRLHQQILKEIPANASIILDVGCGGAWVAKALIPQQKKVISMDVSTINPLRAVKEIPSEMHLGLVADVFNLPIKKESISCIVASEIIEHVPNPKDFIAALFDVLEKDGILIITTPYNEKIQQSLCIHCNQLTPHNAHLHSFTAEKIKSIAPQNAASLTTRTFNNKIFTVSHIILKMRFLPFRIWAWIDKAGNLFFKSKANRLMLVIKK